LEQKLLLLVQVAKIQIDCFVKMYGTDYPKRMEPSTTLPLKHPVSNSSSSPYGNYGCKTVWEVLIKFHLGITYPENVGSIVQ
jgi:hypothetical protein